METLSKTDLAFVIRTYSSITKPGIIMGNLITCAGGFALASKGAFNPWLFIVTLFGLACIIGAGCVANNAMDKDADEKMERTKNRALVKELISTKSANRFAILLAFAGIVVLGGAVNWLSLGVALAGLFVYLVMYSFSKYRTVYGTLVGSVAGAVPPVIGYTAVSNQMDLAAGILFFTLVAWQMPHFYAIAIYRMDDYARASIPVLPLKRGVMETKVQMLFYIALFTAVSSLLAVFGYVMLLQGIIAALLGLGWFFLGLRGFAVKNDAGWARKMFLFSLVVIMGFCFSIPFTVR